VDVESEGILSQAFSHEHANNLNYTSPSKLGSKREAFEELILKGVKKPKTIVQLLEDSGLAVTSTQVFFYCPHSVVFYYNNIILRSVILSLD
jgi:hypothetical protein